MSGAVTERLTNMLAKYPGLPFEYDPELRMFAVGSTLVLLENYQSYQQSSTKPMEIDDATLMVQQSNLRLNVFGTHWQMPRLTHWLEGQGRESMKRTLNYVTDAMVDAYSELGNPDPQGLERTKADTGFGMSFVGPGHPVFQTDGNCACYHVTPNGKFIGEREWELGFAEYDDHNIDRPDQLTVLHVGAGALAHLRKLAD